MRSLILTAAALAALPVIAHAERKLNYSYLEFRYQDSEVEDDGLGIDIEGDGYILGGSLQFSDNTFLFINQDNLDFDDGIELETRTIGGGLILDVGPVVDIQLRGGIVDAEFADGFGRIEDDGYFVSAGARALVTDDIELYGSATRFEFDNFDEEELVTIGADFYFNDSIAVGPTISWVEDTTTVTIGARIFF